MDKNIAGPGSGFAPADAYASRRLPPPPKLCGIREGQWRLCLWAVGRWAVLWRRRLTRGARDRDLHGRMG